MKKMKLAVVFAALVSAFTFSSCLNDGGNDSDYNFYEIVTVSEHMGVPYLKGDAWGYTYMPINSAVLAGLKQTDGSYYKRVQVGVKLADGEVIAEGKTSYKISEIGVMGYLNYKDFTTAPDTLKNDFAIVSLESSDGKVWAKNGYVNIPFTFNTKEQLSQNDFHLYATSATADTLYTRLRQTKGSESVYNRGSALISFHMPFGKPAFEQIYSQLKGDSIIIKVEAKGENKTLSTTVKYRRSEQ